MPVIQVSYYTDPACPWSWALEPALRRLIYTFDESLRFNFIMCGMARDFAEPQTLVAEALAAAASTGMPVDPRLWLEGAPRSSFPACIAVKAAAEQGDPAAYLRRLREGLQCRRRKLDTTAALVEEARAVLGLDLERFGVDLGSHAILEAFAADLERAGAVSPEDYAPGSERVKLPSLEFCAADGTVHGVYGFVSYEALRAAALAAGAEASSAPAPSTEDALRRFGSMSTAEVSAVCELPGPRAPAELWHLATEWRVRPERLGSGELWTLA
jgi:putative protein-disulfide isomerase